MLQSRTSAVIPGLRAANSPKPMNTTAGKGCLGDGRSPDLPSSWSWLPGSGLTACPE